MVVKEMDILKQTPPNGYSTWTEELIRGYQESKGINYGGTVYELGSKPNRMWSNNRSDFDNITPIQTKTQDSTESKLQSEIIKLMAELEAEKSKKLVLTTSESVNSHSEMVLPPLISSDKRTKAYKDMMKRA